MPNIEEIKTEQVSPQKDEEENVDESLLIKEETESPFHSKIIELDKLKLQHTAQAQIPSQQISSSLVSPASLKVELSFVLGHQLIGIDELKTLVEGKIIYLGGTEFEASILLQEKMIAQARLVVVEGVPSLQITKTMSA